MWTQSKVREGKYSYPYTTSAYIAAYTSAVSATEAVTKSEIAHCWRVEGLMLQHRWSQSRRGQPNPCRPQCQTQQGLDTADGLPWPEQWTQDMQFSHPFSIPGPLSRPNCTSSFPAATFPGQNCCLDTSLPQLRSQLYFRNFYFSSRMNLFFHSTNSTAISSLSTWFSRDTFFFSFEQIAYALVEALGY